MKRAKNEVRVSHGDKIFGFLSTGAAFWEEQENPGNMSRQWQVVIDLLLEKLQQREVTHLLHAFTINHSALSIARLGSGMFYCKKMPDIPQCFLEEKIASKKSWNEIYAERNCGVGVDVIGSNSQLFKQILSEVAKETEIMVIELGSCINNNTEANSVELITPVGEFFFTT